MRKMPWLHIILFISTFLSTLLVGSLLISKPEEVIHKPITILNGLPFSLTLMFMLLCHELSHYIASRRHKIKATLPYFIPAPTIFGTLGAFIKMKSPMTNRNALIDIGASGPITGFIVSVTASVIGLSMSDVVNVPHEAGGIVFGNSLLFSFIANIIFGDIPDSFYIMFHPVAYAGWIGFFVTSLNLIPIGQLDGGHIAYALLGERHQYLSKILIPILILLGFFLWEGWIIWAVLLLILGLRHPPVLLWETHLDRKRQFIAYVSAVIFIITFMPVPFRVIP